MKNNKNYFLGLDIGTDSVGYAVTSETYEMLKFRGEPMWGVTTFEAASLAENRRTNRTARRRLDRRQQRVQLLADIFAPEICKVDPNFFIRRKESALFTDDSQYGVKLFDGGLNDKDYHKRFPTIHHLIVDLMNSTERRDIRLIYLACAWLIANRGHFLFNADVSNIKNFNTPYEEFARYLRQDCECSLPWNESIPAEVILNIMQADVSITKKKTMFIEQVYGGKKPSNKSEDSFPYRRDIIVTLLSGGKASPKDLFDDAAYDGIDSVSLGMDEDNFERIISEIGDDGALLRVMRGMYDCALLNKICDSDCISAAKVSVYNQHAKDLKWLKDFIRKYSPAEYYKVFRRAEAGNYVAYSFNIKNCENGKSLKKASKDVFSDYLKKIVTAKSIADTVDDTDREQYEDMLHRLDLRTFLPKQKDTDNRVIPQQLYRYELSEILSHASSYLPMLNVSDADGITNKDKILSIFDFKIPYYVGPLNQQSPNAWLERKEGKIYPWNFEKMVDLDESEQRFIKKMTNICTYLPGEDVLPYCSLLYSRFTVLNELNNLKINQHSIPVTVKQEIYTKLFKESSKKVTTATIRRYLESCGYMIPSDELSGVDTTLNASLKSYHSFKRLLDSGTLTEEQAEDIINHAAYSEDKIRMAKWLENHYPKMSADDRKYILRLNLKEFGRLSKKLLTEIFGCVTDGDGEAMTVMDALWQTNDNLMQLLSERYTFRDQIAAFSQDYYSVPENKKTLSERLSDMYISNAVKRPIIRTLDIVSDVVKATGNAPTKIFVEMARGGMQEQKGKRTISREQQILDLYKQVRNEDVPRLKQELESMGDMANNRLQSDRLFLYYMQLGRCMYTGKPIDINQLSSKTYDIDHIYPQSKVQDDSILNNKVLVLSSVNGDKSDVYPIDASIRSSMNGFWSLLRENRLITDEKYRRLTRSSGFTDDELHQFINRQLVETRQSTKVVAQLLKERYPNTDVVYVKAGMVSEFRQEFDMLKCRSVNDLHHAKDAYLNVVVGNVYHEKFTRRWFDTSQKYNISVKKIFENVQRPYGNEVWRGSEDLAKVRAIMRKNYAHVTQYALCRHSGQNGGLFDQNPLKAHENLIPLKEGKDTAKYGGYNGSTSTFFLLAGFQSGRKKEIMFFPVDLMYSRKVLENDNEAVSYIQRTLAANKKKVTGIYFPIGKRILKINTLLSLDGFLVCLSSGSIKDGRAGFLPITQFVCKYETERYIKRLERVCEKCKTYSNYKIVKEFDGVSAEENLQLFDLFNDKIRFSVYSKRPGIPTKGFDEQRDIFAALPLEQQCSCLMKMLMLFSRKPNAVDLSDIELSPNSCKPRKSLYLSGWKSDYQDVRIVDVSSSGLFSSRSENLLDLL